MNLQAEEQARRKLEEIKLAEERAKKKREGGDADDSEEDDDATPMEERKRTLPKTPGEIDEPMRVRLTRKYIETI